MSQMFSQVQRRTRFMGNAKAPCITAPRRTRTVPKETDSFIWAPRRSVNQFEMELRPETLHVLGRKQGPILVSKTTRGQWNMPLTPRQSSWGIGTRAGTQENIFALQLIGRTVITRPK